MAPGVRPCAGWLARVFKGMNVDGTGGGGTPRRRPPYLKAVATDPEITRDELAARQRPPATPLTVLPGDTYQEGEAIVFTAQFHLRRGYCCGSGCRHCPYGFPPPAHPASK